MKRTKPHQNTQQCLIGLLTMTFCMLVSTGIEAQTINGPTNVNQGSTYAYTLSHSSNILFMVWIAPGGTVISSGNTYANVRWDQSGSKTLVADFQDPYNFYTITKNVTVNATAPSTPSTPTVSSNGCGQAVLSRGTPPGGVSWYWQTSSNGTSLANSSTTYTVTGTGTYYLRARNGSGTWSSSSSSRYVGIIDLNAGIITEAHTICYGGNPDQLNSFEAASGISGSFSYQWQWSSSGAGGWTDISGQTGATYNPPGPLNSTRYYRRKVTCATQTKYSNSIKVTVRPNLSAGSIGTPDPICVGGNIPNIPNVSSPSGGNNSYSYGWQWSSNGSTGWTNISGAIQSSYNPPGTLTQDRWYRRSVSSCEQTKYSIGIKVDVVSNPNMPSAPSIANNCGNTILTRGTPPQNITWHWQSSEFGEDTSSSSTNTSKTFNSNGTYYLRARNSTGCWSAAQIVSYTVTQPTTWYADTDTDGYGDAAATSSDCDQPTGYVSNSSDHDDTTVMITNLAPQTYYSDVDGDGFGVASPTIYASFRPLGYADNTSDQCPEVPGTTNGCEYVPPTLSDENYVYTRAYQTTMSSSTSIKKNNEVLENVTYFDGLGRARQQVSVRASGTATRANSPNSPSEWSMDWTEGTGSTPFFNRNGSIAENERFYGPNPFGETALIWRCGNEPDNSSDGGWNTDFFNVDKTKTYRYMVWVRRDQSNNGSTYHGTQNVANLSGVAQGNPYFWYGDLPQLGEWYLLVGVIHPYTHGNTDTGVSGVYDMQGNRVIDATEFKWRSDTTTARFRSYLYYSTDVNVRQYFYRPILEIVDGNEIPLQEMFASRNAGDIVTHLSYDDYGRQNKEWLPYHEPTGNFGSYRGDVSTATQQYYQNNFADDFVGLVTSNVNAYSEREFEPSPLNRVEEQAAPGKDWQLGGGHGIRFNYAGNVANEVRRYKVTLSFANNTYSPTLVADGHYAINELYKNITKDENWTSGTDHMVEEFTDKQGRVVLKRTYAGSAHDTYYVYDDYGNLSYVMPPKVVHDGSISATELSELCYQYVYDHRNRLVEKKVPGKGWEYIVYNVLDQPVLTQDAVQRPNKEWLFTKYDAFGRVAFTGLHQHPSVISRETMQGYADNTSGYTQYETEQGSSSTIAGTTIYYSNTAIPTTVTEIHTINYYDSYVATNGLNVPADVLGQATLTGYSLKGLPTVSKIRVLDNNDWINTVTGYDKKGRPIYTASANSYLNTTDIVETKLDFAGKVLETKSSHTYQSNPVIVTRDIYEYDHQGRLVAQNQTIDGRTETIVQNSYDRIGQLVNKSVGGSLAYQAPLLEDMVEVSVSGNEISSTAASSAWNNSGFASSRKIKGDGYVEWRASTNNRNIMVGLSADNSNAHYNTIDFALYTQYQGQVRVYENGSNKGTFGNYSIGDLFRVARYGDTVKYYHNDELIYTSTVSTSAELLADASFYHTGSEIEDFVIKDAEEVLRATPLQIVDYAYNTRGWLKQINDPHNLGTDLFGFAISYNELLAKDSNSNVYGTELFNGNISEVFWHTANDASSVDDRGYFFEYDALNRIEKGDYIWKYSSDNYHSTDNGSGTAAFNEELTYDKNGNIASLKRGGSSQSYGYIDQLTYAYDDGNKLMRVTDAGTDADPNASDFKDGTNGGDDYTYDDNGNLLTDANKGITSIAYNHLNLPTSIGINSETITYIYDATGVKLKKMVSTGEDLQYAGNYVYRDGTLEFFGHPEGYSTPDGQGGYDHIYQYKDHLGNVRLSYVENNGSLDIVEENNYYPFGLKHKGYNTGISPLGNDVANRWKFGGKEYDESLGLDWYDYGARMFAPDIARWNGIDASSENYYHNSPYHYAGNNPIKFVDFDGNDYGVIVTRGVNGAMGTITIQARFLVSQASEGLLNRHGRDRWNAQSGRNVFVSGGLRALRRGNADAYVIDVDVTTQVSGNNDGQGRGNSDRDRQVNNDQTGTLNSFDVEEDGFRENQRGGTSSDEVDVKRGEGGGTTEHEVSHAMGVGHTGSEGGNLSPTGDGNVGRGYIAESLKGVGIGGDTSGRNRARGSSGIGDGTLLNGSTNQGLQTGKVISLERYNRILNRIQNRLQRRRAREARRLAR